MRVERTIAYTHKRNIVYKGEKEFLEIDLDILRSLFNPPVDDPDMYCPYKINEKQVEILEGYFDIEFDFSNNIYFLHTYCSY